MSESRSDTLMDKALLDTDILSEILKARNANVIRASATYLAAFGYYTFSTVTVVEVVRGYQRQGNTTRVQQFLATLQLAEVLTLDQITAELAGQIAGNLERAGQTIGLADSVIAATALVPQLTLVTGNQAHFQRVQALGYPLKLENWRV